MSLSLVAHAPIPHSTGVSAAIDTTGANFLIIASTANRFIVPSLSDSKSNSWGSNIGGSANSSWQTGAGYTVAPNVGAGHTFTISGPNSQGIVAAFNIVSQTSPFDAMTQDANDTVGAATIQPPSITPAQANNLCFSMFSLPEATRTGSVDGGFTIIDTLLQDSGTGTAVGLVLAYLAQSSAAAIHPTWTYSSTSAFGLTAQNAVFNLSQSPFDTLIPRTFGTIIG